MEKRLVIGITGGQSTKCGVVNENGTILERCAVTSLLTDLDGTLLCWPIRSALVGKTESEGTVIKIGAERPNARSEDDRICPNLRWAKDPTGSRLSFLLPICCQMQPGCLLS